MMPTLPIVALLILAFSAPARSDGLNIAVDIPPVHSLVSRVMEGTGNSSNIVISGGVSPHHFALRPSEAQILQEADIVFWVGDELSPAFARAVDALAGNSISVPLLPTISDYALVTRDDPIFANETHSEHSP